jgi:P22 coat protein - gene protein 5
MANAFGNYIPQLYANEALPHLRNSLGFAGRVLHTFEDERTAFAKGEYINIKRPSRFTVSNAPATAEDLTEEDVQIQLAYWRETKWKASDKELTFTDPRVISDHVRPQAYSLAADVNSTMHGLYASGVGTQYPQASPTPSTLVVADILGARGRLHDNGVPMNDGRLHLCLDGQAETTLLGLPQFSQADGAGAAGVTTQTDGTIGKKFGVNLFSDQQAGLQTYTSGSAGKAAGDSALAVNLAAGYKTGLTSIVFDGGATTETIAAGDQITFAGHKAHYTAASAVTMSSGAGTLVLSEGLVESVADNEVITILASETDETDPLIMFHENAFAMVTAPIAMSSELEQMGVAVGVATDEDAGISVRTRMYAVPNSSEIHFAMDILFGVKVLNSMYACKLLR